MSPAEIEPKAREILGLALKTELPPSGDVLREDNPAWDSLKHVELIFMLEDEFDVRLSEDQMASIRSLHDIVETVSGSS